MVLCAHVANLDAGLVGRCLSALSETMTLRFSTLPLSTNQLYRSVRGRSIISEKGRANKDALGWEARSQYRGKPLSGPLAIEVHIAWPDRRRHDWDNLKVLYDAMNGIVWDDDNQICDAHVIRELGSKEPGVELRVWEV
jgi:Holliday junction resolvase RusA-like endonuclease